ncbi:uncharacterized protein METZ01_LOCUS386729, partial [marine metagenome]
MDISSGWPSRASNKANKGIKGGVRTPPMICELEHRISGQ